MKQVELNWRRWGYIAAGYSQVKNEQKRNPERKGNRDRRDEYEKMPSRGGRR